jgi:hypothetical protein
VREAKLVEEHVRDLHPFDGLDLSVELAELCVVKLSLLVMGISNTLVNLRMLPIGDTPKLSKFAQEVLVVADLILEPLREERAFDAGP